MRSFYVSLFSTGEFFLEVSETGMAGVRRLHDTDKSGWFLLLGFIPLVVSIIVFVFMCLHGPVGANRFGPAPKAVSD